MKKMRESTEEFSFPLPKSALGLWGDIVLECKCVSSSIMITGVAPPPHEYWAAWKTPKRGSPLPFPSPHCTVLYVRVHCGGFFISRYTGCGLLSSIRMWIVVIISKARFWAYVYTVLNATVLFTAMAKKISFLFSESRCLKNIVPLWVGELQWDERGGDREIRSFQLGPLLVRVKKGHSSSEVLE